MFTLNDVEAGKCKMDFHLHTTNSDGEQNVEVIKQAKENGLSRIVITDHNMFTYTSPFMHEDMMVVLGI